MEKSLQELILIIENLKIIIYNFKMISEILHWKLMMIEKFRYS
jgi:hypothetical protein